MGTPHQGSFQTTWGSILASILGFVKQDNVDVVNGLEKEAPRLIELQKRFYNLLSYHSEASDPIDIICFF